MTARAGMATLIADLRALCNAGSADQVIGGVTYWTDDQLQAELDRARFSVRRLSLESDPVYVAGDYQYFDYSIPAEIGRFEYDSSGSVEDGWRLTDSSGAETSESYTVNESARVITFASDQASAAYYLDCRAYDLEAAAAAVWTAKAGFAASNVDWAIDNQRISASQEISHCQSMAAAFRAVGGLNVIPLFRSDENF